MDQTDLSVVNRSTNLRGRKITADYVADALREAIQNGSLPDGAVLNQVAIAEHLGVSRVPVREAMRQLLAEGLIQSEAHQISVVRSLSIEQIIEIYDYRALLEGYMTEKAVPAIDKETIKQLRSINDKMATIDDHAEWLRQNAEFHHLILARADDETGQELVDQLRARAERYMRMWSGGGGIHRPKEVRREHRRIIDLIAAADAPGARAEVEKHIRDTGERVVAYGRTARAGAEGPTAKDPTG